MIPKIIHYCWLSGDEYPDLIKKCMDSWKLKLPDYEFILWDTKRFPMDESLWVQQAFENKKYAFAADYIRLYAVYHHGGIYLDLDIEVLKSFNSLLDLPYFIGSEGDSIIEAGVFGAEKNAPWLGDCLRHYDNRSFVQEDGSFDMLTLPRIMMKQIHLNHEIVELPKPVYVDNVSYEASTKLLMFPEEFFCAKNQGTGIIENTDNTFCIHHFAMSWVSKNYTFLPDLKRKLMKIFGVKSINVMIQLLGLKKLKKLLKLRK